ncbi:hypothetical protein Agub_g13400 [Astrephomene gubernaculifera]|uniref:Uncharacterized protein n=1 Tax=Astrephomene gubernaculifera TaxID=47775 RepID=A0AAD3DZT3_9CHLO|nr:hypothetical protein Agub_g13400 [Astrephomene gubernaculifera]
MTPTKFSAVCAVALRNVFYYAETISGPLSRRDNVILEREGSSADLEPDHVEEVRNVGITKASSCKRPHFDEASGSSHSSEPRGHEVNAETVAQHRPLYVYGSLPGEEWPLDLLKLLVEHVASLPPGCRVRPHEAIALLGWAELPDPDGAIGRRVRYKLHSIRNQLAKGVDPLAGRMRPGRMAKKTYNWRVWLQKAFLQLPNQEGTLNDLAAVLEADPDIAPKLDKRSDSTKVAAPRWKRNVSHTVSSIPGVINTGQKRGRLVIYHYDEEAARQLGERGKPAKVPKHRVPHMGVHDN